jgi:hypothetical protein
VDQRFQYLSSGGKRLRFIPGDLFYRGRDVLKSAVGKDPVLPVGGVVGDDPEALLALLEFRRPENNLPFQIFLVAIQERDQNEEQSESAATETIHDQSRQNGRSLSILGEGEIQGPLGIGEGHRVGYHTGVFRNRREKQVAVAIGQVRPVTPLERTLLVRGPR